MLNAPDERIAIKYKLGALGKDSFLMALGLFFHIIVSFIVQGLFTPLLVFEHKSLTIGTNAVFLLCMGWSFYRYGARIGQKQAQHSELIFTRQIKGEKGLNYDTCFHPKKAWLAYIVALLPFLVMGLMFSLKVNEYYDFSNGDAVIYSNIEITPLLWHALMRAIIMPYIAMALSFGTKAVIWVERLCPVWITLVPLAYVIGYCQGEHLRIKEHCALEFNKKKSHLTNK